MGTSNRTTPRPPRGGVRHFSVEPIALVLVDTWYETKKYDTDFYAGQAGPARASAAAMVPLILQAVGPVTSILDVGCGVGAWLAEWASAGIEDYLGVDGDYVDRANLLVSPEHFRAQDLKTPLDLGRRFDLVTSFEVAEHLPEAVAAKFVAGLVRHADVVVFSAAIPGQGGVGHVNEQWQSYWARKFTDLGLETHDDLRWKVWEDDRIEFYYAQNTVIYTATGHVVQSAGALVRRGAPRLREAPSDAALQVEDVGGHARALPRAGPTGAAQLRV